MKFMTGIIIIKSAEKYKFLSKLKQNKVRCGKTRLDDDFNLQISYPSNCVLLS